MGTIVTEIPHFNFRMLTNINMSCVASNVRIDTSEISQMLSVSSLTVCFTMWVLIQITDVS